MHSELFTIFNPNADDLLRGISAHIDTGMIEEIAAADYGWRLPECLIALRQIRDQGLFTFPLPSELREVLELIRWSQPDDPKWKPGGFGQRGHWIRAFACAALLRAFGDTETRVLLAAGSNQTVIQLIDSLRIVDPSLYKHAAAFVAWLLLECEADERPEELAFLGVALLWFGLNLQPAIPDQVIISLAEWITAQEAQASGDGSINEHWLLRTTYYDLRHAGWKHLGSSLAGLDISKLSPAARDWVILIGSALSGDQAATI